MIHYSVLAVTPTSQDWQAGYAAAAGAIVAKHGGKYIARTDKHQYIEGAGPQPAVRVILEWPSKEAAIAFMNDPEYTPHLAARTKVLTANIF
ncbi:DUF1330 domain-containing protein [Paraglaciecola aquimarina]|uniref:DUF1330 domain-containing protein n=1 Tax=Paraglaciecola aquimarina TaxID=1235557 RepID=A0ABU3SW81_9ALTE|nr:DUF1330 domain-containing protein [Paraglaciecola aquimarina]MDU0354280.1 DUF1330 domain-containing protein [Paraglaciecola aquimarina]